MEKKLHRIHDTAIRILEDVGMKLHHPGVLESIRQKGVKVSGNTAYFLRHQVMEWIHKAPEEFTLYARNPEYNAVIGGDHIECMAGYGCTAIIGENGARRDALLDDYITFAKLVHQSEHFHINGGILAQPADVDIDQSSLIMLYAALLYSDKCLMGVSGSSRQIEDVMGLLCLVFGGKDELAQKPRVLIPVSTTSPLQIDEMGLNAILAGVAYRQPIIISPAPAAGTTGPISLAGNLAMATAEVLAATVITQMLGAGTPVIFGLNALGADLRTGNVSIGSPAFALQAAYAARLARRYRLPSRGGGGLNDAKGVSVQSGYESMLTLLTAFQNEINLIIHSAGILDSFAGMSYEQFLVDLEMISMIQFYLNDLDVDKESLSFDVIKEVGPGGAFLTTQDTLLKCRTHSWNPSINFRGPLHGRSLPETIWENIQKRKQNMLAAYRQPGLEPDIQQQLEAYLRSKGISQDLITRIQTVS